MLEKDSLSRREFLEGTGAVAAASALAGCDGSGGPGTDGRGATDGNGDVQKGGTLNLINSTMTSLDPVAIGDTASGYVANQCYEGLMTYPNGTRVAERNLATGYETSDDFLEYTFTLEEGVQFQNGAGEMTAADVVYSWERLAASPASERRYFILDSLGIAARNRQGKPFRDTYRDQYQPGSMQLEATGEYEVSFTLRRPFHATLQMLAFPNFSVVPEGIVGDVQGYDGEVSQSTLASEATYGTGPFQLSTWQKGDSVAVTKFEEFRRDGEPYLDGIHWEIIEDPEPKYRYATNGNADLFAIPTQYYDPEKVSVTDATDDGRKTGTYGPLTSGQASGEEVAYRSVPELGTYYLAFDVSNVDPAVRKAAAYVIDREEVSSTTFKGRFPAGFHLTPPGIYPGGTEAYDRHVRESYPYGVNESRIDRATQVMEDAGYGPNDTYDLTINSYPGIFTEMIRGVRDKLAAAHVDVSVEPTEFATTIEKGKRGNLQSYTLGWTADWPAPDNFLRLIAPQFTDVSELGDSALTYTNWSSVDTAARRRAADAWGTVSNNLAPTEAARRARAEAYVEMEEANWEDVVLVPLIHRTYDRFHWDHVHVEPFGSMGVSRQTHDTTWKER